MIKLYMYHKYKPFMQVNIPFPNGENVDGFLLAFGKDQNSWNSAIEKP